MNKHLLILGIAVLLLTIGLSGCEETFEVTGDTDKVEIIDYSVTTKWHIPRYGTFQTYSKPGFYKHYPENAYEPIYIVRGTVKNIAGYELNTIEITAKFYDSKDVYLDSVSDEVYRVPDTYTKDFEIIGYKGREGGLEEVIDNFENVYSVKFEISAS